MSVGRFRTERRLQKLKGNARDKASISLTDQQHDVLTLNGVQEKVSSSSQEIVNEQIRQLKDLHAAEVDKMKSDHQVGRCTKVWQRKRIRKARRFRERWQRND